MVLEENKNTSKNRRYRDSFKYAFYGIKTVYHEERNMRTHLLLAGGIILFCLFLDLVLSEWLWIVLCIFLMLVMEIWNTVIENVVDLTIGEQFHPLAKKAKDMAASAVLLTSVFSVIIGLLILVPKLWQLIF